MFNNIFVPRRAPAADQQSQPGQCPACGSVRLAVVVDANARGLPVLVPKLPKLKLWREASGIGLRSNHFHMCRECGLLFRQESASELNAYIARYAIDTQER